LYFWESFTYSKAKAIFFVSEEDRRLAIEKFKIPDNKCHISAYGIPQTKVLERPAESVRQTKASVGIKPEEKVIMFFGALKYLPNIEALEIIINELLPRLQKRINTPYKVLVCGGGISADYEKQLKAYSDKHLIYAGFVPDIDEYTGSADVVINPVLSAGGVRTRVVEALGFNKTVVSTITGAHGIDARLCGKKLKVVADNDWDSFTEKIAEALSEHEKTPDSFFDHYSWQAIANELKQVLQS
jgi:glycosyltransferase involved in cell wall biosynthesis